ncbi:MAG: serine hydrolase domain-containing protein [Bacteroidales bacterium]
MRLRFKTVLFFAALLGLVAGSHHFANATEGVATHFIATTEGVTTRFTNATEGVTPRFANAPKSVATKEHSLPSQLQATPLQKSKQVKDWSRQVDEAVQYLEQVRERWGFPGASIAIIKDGKTLYTGGVGVREEGKEEGVDAQTLFPIGSISKSFTAMVVASLVAEGKLKWNDKIKDILPDFEMYDKWVENNIEVQDVMLHNTGLKAQLGTNLASFGYNRNDIYNIFGLLKPKNKFRDSYGYNNITFIIAGKIIEKCSGKSWEENVRERIFIPLGMNDSHINTNEYEAVENRAQYHHIKYDREPATSHKTVTQFAHFYTPQGADRAGYWLTAIGPAGSISSTAQDMAKYIEFHLNSGRVGSKQLLPKKQMEYLHTGHNPISKNSKVQKSYGLCWNVVKNSDYTIVSHTGSVRGFTAIAAFIPHEQLGFVMLVNSNSPREPRDAMLNKVVDIFTGKSSKDYNSTFFEQWLTTTVKKRAAAAERAKGSTTKEPPSATLLPGVYRGRGALGNVVVERRGEELFITTGSLGWVTPLLHQSGNRYGFRREGFTFPVTFFFEEEGANSNAIKIGFGNGEDFGLWKRVE